MPLPAGWVFESYVSPSTALSPAMRARVAQLVADPGDVWDDPTFVPTAVRVTQGLVRVGVAPGSYFESVARADQRTWSRCGCEVGVVTADDRLVLSQRSHRVESSPGQWMLSAGETADPRHDVGPAGPWDPLVSAARGVLEELAIPVEDLVLVELAVSPTGVGAAVAMRSQMSFAELAECAASADDAWEREQLIGAPLDEPVAWPPLDSRRTRAAAAVAAWASRSAGDG